MTSEQANKRERERIRKKKKKKKIFLTHTFNDNVKSLLCNAKNHGMHINITTTTFLICHIHATVACHFPHT